MTPLELAASPERAVTARDAKSEITIVQTLRGELDRYYTEMRRFSGETDSALIFMRLAAFTARASEVRGQIQRGASNRLNALRIKEIDPFLDECDRQFKLWSRAQSVRQMEADLTKGFA